MTMDILQPGKLEIGRVISQTFGVIGRNFVVFFVLSLVVLGIPTAIMGYVQTTLVGDALTTGNFSPGVVVAAIIGGLVAITTTSILQGAFVYGTVQDLNGAHPKIGECLTIGLRAFLPLFLVSLSFGIAVSFGMILLIVPGIMIACAWCVAVPALVVDRTTIEGALRRSAELTRGNRWRIFGLFLVIFGIMFALGLLVAAIATAFVVPLAMAGATAEAAATSPAVILVNIVTNALGSMLGSAGVAVLYVELRRAREGVGPEWLSKVFE